MNHKQLMAQIDSAKQHTAEMAIASPGIYHQYGEWVAAKRSLEIAQRNLKKTEEAWLAMLKPALGDPLLKELAERKGLIPAAPQQATPEPLTSFDDPRVQIVYDLLCSDEAPPPEQHWEGWVARRIVDALSAAPVETEPVAKVADLFHAVRDRLVAQGADLYDPLFTRPAPGVPEGFALVPVEPTEEMIDAALKVALPGALRAAWARMLAAARRREGTK